MALEVMAAASFRGKKFGELQYPFTVPGGVEFELFFSALLVTVTGQSSGLRGLFIFFSVFFPILISSD